MKYELTAVNREMMETIAWPGQKGGYVNREEAREQG